MSHNTCCLIEKGMRDMINRILLSVVFICTFSTLYAQESLRCYDINPMSPYYTFIRENDTMKCFVSLQDRQSVFLCSRIEKDCYLLQFDDTVTISLHLRRQWNPLRPFWNTRIWGREIRYSPIGCCEFSNMDKSVSFQLRHNAYQGPRIVMKTTCDPFYRFARFLLGMDEFRFTINGE